MIYRWVPACAREVAQAFRESVPATDITPEVAAVPAIYGKPLPGAPVIMLKPLPDRLSLQCNAAQTRYYRAMFRGRERVKAGASVDDTTSAVLDSLDEAYPEDLQVAVLEACVSGWENVIGPSGPIAYAGKWDVDGMVLPGAIKAELFRDIVNGSAFTPEEVEAFTLPQESLPS